MRVLILGGDGYLGWPTAMNLSQQGHEVAVVDNMIKRYWEAELAVEPLTPIRPLPTRVKQWKAVSGKDIRVFICDISTIYSTRCGQKSSFIMQSSLRHHSR